MPAAGYNVEPAMNTATPVSSPFRQKVPPAMLILSQDRARIGKAYINSGTRPIVSRKAYLKQVNDEMGIFKTGRVGQAIAEGSAYHLNLPHLPLRSQLQPSTK